MLKYHQQQQKKNHTDLYKRTSWTELPHTVLQLSWSHNQISVQQIPKRNLDKSFTLYLHGKKKYPAAFLVFY